MRDPLDFSHWNFSKLLSYNSTRALHIENLKMGKQKETEGEKGDLKRPTNAAQQPREGIRLMIAGIFISQGEQRVSVGTPRRSGMIYCWASQITGQGFCYNCPWSNGWWSKKKMGHTDLPSFKLPKLSSLTIVVQLWSTLSANLRNITKDFLFPFLYLIQGQPYLMAKQTPPPSSTIYWQWPWRSTLGFHRAEKYEIPGRIL